jgi:tight adherence protein B
MAPASSPGASAAAASQGSVIPGTQAISGSRATAGTQATAGTRSAAPATWSWPLILGLGGVFLALLLALLLLTGAVRGGDRARRLERQLDRHYRAGQQAPPEADDEGKVAGTVVGWVASMLSDSVQERLARRLDLAGIARKPAEWVLLAAAASLVLAALITLLTGNLVAGILLGGLAGWLGARLLVSWRIGRRRAAFIGQLPGVLQLVAGSLQSGFSLPQALGAVVREDSQPAAGEFSRALAEARITGELEVALDRVAVRMDSTDLRWAVMAIRIQRTVGGNLVEVLRTTADTMRERGELRRNVRALSAEGRMSAAGVHRRLAVPDPAELPSAAVHHAVRPGHAHRCRGSHGARLVVDARAHQGGGLRCLVPCCWPERWARSGWRSRYSGSRWRRPGPARAG